MYELNDFNSIQISVASPEKIREWSYGEVTKPETINYRTQKPERDGLFCEKIFGPTKDWECHCGKYKRVRYKGIKCEKCGVEITRSKVRRERMGHISLAAPVSHIWYFRGVPSRIGLILGMGPKQLEQVIYFAAYVVLDPGNVPGLVYKQVINDKQLRELEEQYGDSSVTGLKVGMGAEAIRELLMAVDLEKECQEMREIIDSNSGGQKLATAVKRIEILESFRKSGNRPEWMILTVLPVIPPEIRPMVQLDGGRFATSDLNDLYRRVINRNNRLKKMIEIGAPEMIIKNEKRMLQEAVDALIDNGRHGKPLLSASNREIKSLSAMLRGKQGRFRQNLLGKRVDYSGRSVIVVGPELKIYQCGLPKEMALELFKPFVMKRLVAGNKCHNIKSAKRFVEKGKAEVWDVLESVIKDHPVLLNRAPTLHRLSIQAFEPVLIEGRAIKISPLVCGPFNADFDGDQMAVHLPLSTEAQAEARFLMLSANNILKLADGKSVMSPTQDMIIGAYYLTILRREAGRTYDEFARPSENGQVYIPPVYASVNEAVMAYQTKIQQCQDEIFVRRTVELPEEKFGNLPLPYYIEGQKLSLNGETELEQSVAEYKAIKNNTLVNTAVVYRNEEGKLVVSGIIKTTVGRIIYNDDMPQDLDFVKRDTPEDYLKYELADEFIGGAKAIGKKHLSRIVEACFRTGGAPKASAVLDAIKERGYKYSTYAALTTSVFDMKIPAVKEEIVSKAESTVARIAKNYARGLMRDEERYTAVINAWDTATDEVAKALTKQGREDKFNPIWMMADSGARGSIDQIKQLAGMRGLMVNPQGKKIEVPVKSCYKKGLSVLEYFISSHGGRKGLADTALKTADSGYLTRRLVDVAQDVIVREDDCCAGKKPRGMKIRAIMNADNQIVEGLADRLTGRFASEDVINPTTGEIIVECNEFITQEKAKYIASLTETVSIADNASKYYGRGIAKDVELAAQQPIAKKGERFTADICRQMLENGMSEVPLFLIEEVAIRSVFTCMSKHGVCAKCYGKNMATTRPIKIGEAVGVIAAQSIGEPGTQLTMRTFHTGGIAATGDITQGLPRVEELFEARKPKGVSTISEIDGTVLVDNSNNTNHIVIRNEATNETKEYDLPYNAELKVKTGDKIAPGAQLNAGPKDPQKILSIVGFRAVQEYILEQVQSVYRSQGVEINDKHVEIIVRQMLRKIKVENAGTTEMLPGELVDLFYFEQQNEMAIEKGGIPASGKRTLLGITKASLATESFLSAASFQETAKVLTDAAIKNKRDYLMGLKENVIIGKLIPAGTGLKQYRECSPVVLSSYTTTLPEAEELAVAQAAEGEDNDQTVDAANV
ncbi:MAG: DNA-directed RNA polymerase subunit beta' [Clostridia bacterium]|nr:DNA-directed RNA polymerase subunit beta' [Clostridia bacterium]